ncbi:MAG: hypothetical protein N2170_01330, partial [Bacteroidia bacterium]|nr:hypothetical protein [Bacteroidia bacterium]
MVRPLWLVGSVMAFLSAQECGIIYITPTGANSGVAGTRANPASLSYGLSLVSPSARYLRLAVGTYTLNGPLSLSDSLIIEGGYLPGSNWQKTNTATTKLVRSTANVEPNPARLTAIQATGRRGFRLQDLEIEVANAPAAGVSIYGLYLNGCRDYTIARCKIHAGKGGDGVNGLPGTNGAAGAPGQPGGLGCRRCDPTTAPYTNLGGSGGNSWSSGLRAGGAGGNGGNRGTGTNCVFCSLCDPGVISAPNGQNGLPGNGPGAGGGGAGKPGLCYCTNGLNATDIINYFNNCPTPFSDPAHTGEDGQPGADGQDGQDGQDGVAQFTGGYFVPQDGTDGTDGTDGSGGGGGGGGGSIGCIPGLSGATYDWNSPGGGG